MVQGIKNNRTLIVIGTVGIIETASVVIIELAEDFALGIISLP